MNLTRSLALVVLFVGLVAIVMGTVFIGQGVSKDNQLKEAMRQEQVTLSLEEGAPPALIDNAAKAQAAGDLI